MAHSLKGSNSDDTPTPSINDISDDIQSMTSRARTYAFYDDATSEATDISRTESDREWRNFSSRQRDDVNDDVGGLYDYSNWQQEMDAVMANKRAQKHQKAEVTLHNKRDSFMRRSVRKVMDKVFKKDAPAPNSSTNSQRSKQVNKPNDQQTDRPCCSSRNENKPSDKRHPREPSTGCDCENMYDIAVQQWAERVKIIEAEKKKKENPRYL